MHDDIIDRGMDVNILKQQQTGMQKREQQQSGMQAD